VVLLVSPWWCLAIKNAFLLASANHKWAVKQIKEKVQRRENSLYASPIDLGLQSEIHHCILARSEFLLTYRRGGQRLPAWSKKVLHFFYASCNARQLYVSCSFVKRGKLAWFTVIHCWLSMHHQRQHQQYTDHQKYKTAWLRHDGRMHWNSTVSSSSYTYKRYFLDKGFAMWNAW